jgi:F-type H+-transporting ATPase subunit epsilon
MAENFKFELVSPEKLLVSAEVAEVIVPGSEGDFTMLADHAPFISLLRPGILRVPSLNGQHAQFYVRGGFAEAEPKTLTVLAEMAMPLAELTAGRLEAEIRDAESGVAMAKDDEARFIAGDTLERLISLQYSLQLAA